MPYVTLNAVVARINRKLRRQLWSSMLCKTRGWRALSNLGEFHEIDINRNVVIATHVNPEARARELGVLAAWEKVAPPREECTLRAV